MRECEIAVETFERKRERATDGTYTDLVKEAICTGMFGDEAHPRHEARRTFRYPEDLGQLCPRLVDSLTGFLPVLENGETLPWRYRGTPYEKGDRPGPSDDRVRPPTRSDRLRNRRQDYEDGASSRSRDLA